VTDQMAKLRAREAAKDYMLGAKLRIQAEELSDKSLAKKFTRNEATIKRVKLNMPVRVLDKEDQDLIRLCIREKDRLDRRLGSLTKACLAVQYQVTTDAISLELDFAGFESPKAKRKKKVSAA